MSEVLNTGAGESVENTSPNGAETLAELSDDFDPEKAKALVERNTPDAVELKSPEKHEIELSPEDAAKEYLSLLDKLSEDFTYPYFKEDRKGDHHYARNITTELGLKYSDNPHYRWVGYASTEAGETDGTMLRIACADSILGDEIARREEGRRLRQRLEEIETDDAENEREHKDLGRIHKLMSMMGFTVNKASLESQRKQVQRESENRIYQINRRIAKELAIAYNETGYYDYNGVDHGESTNEENNEHFFGLDNPERAKMVERAIAIRQAYEPIWKKDE